MEKLLWILPFIFATTLLPAQHEHHGAGADSSRQMEVMQEQQPMLMTHAYSRSLPMNRNASGTGWLPDNSPMYGYMLHGRSGWNFMFHGNIFLQYNWQNFNNEYRRGGREFQAPNWFMGMAIKPMGRDGLLAITGMFSLDPLVMPGNGYRLLFQSGETWSGKPLIDRQHPHDLISALSVGYTHRLSVNTDLIAYLGFPGEPALGAPAFMHRISSISNPNAPLGHHWQDATHITYGVATLGLRFWNWKVEGSVFTGREPDEERLDFDRPRFDSYSYRISYNPSPSLAFQFSQGFLESPEVLSPDDNVRRTTASVIYSRRWGALGYNGLLAWGLNDAGHGHREHSITWENNLHLSQADVLYSRYEWIQKSAEELGLEEQAAHDAIEPIHSLTLGYSRRLFTIARTNLFLGGQLSWQEISSFLEEFYGMQPLSGQVYVRITPGEMF